MERMNKRQVTVRERNSWENETFNYVLYVTEEELEIIREKSELYGDGEIKVYETNYTLEQINNENDKSLNSYMDFMASYELGEGALTNWKDRGDCFYKGNGLIKVNNN